MSYAGGFSESAFEPSTLVNLLRWRALNQPDQRVYTFLVDGETEEVHLTYGELDRQARAIAASLQSLGATGERALLLYPPGLEYIAGFFGCLYAGVIAVPAYPPDPARLDRTLPRLQAMVADAQATVALTTAPILSMAEFVFAQAPDLAALQWLTTDTLADGTEDGWQEPALTGDSLAFLQYTSGSTRTPRGVMLSHDNLLYNSSLIRQAMEVTPDAIVVSWLPPYHDMGLIGAILQPLYAGCTCILMSPVSFLQRPFRWLQAISRYRATISGGPNFAYDLCVRKITPEQRATLDLSCWSLAFNGAEPVRSQTLDRFAAAFEPCGFRREAFYPCYGLAEATLIVSGGLRSVPPVIHTVQGAALEQNRVVDASATDEDARALVGCGQNLPGQKIVIVDPETLVQCPPDQVGEIWVAGPSVAQGYWNRPEETEQTFRAYMADTGEGPFLRTGDLGFMRDGELFITGRIKDLIIIRGRNHYPQDIELTVEQSHPALRPGCGAAFSVDVSGEERLVVVQEVYTNRPWDPDEVVGAIRQAVAETHEVQVYAVVLIEPRSIPKTSSGKIQRRACRAMFLAGTLDVVEASILEEAAPPEKEEKHRAPETLLVKALLALEPEQRQALLESHIQEQVARVLKMSPSQLDPQQPLNTLGLDSVVVVDLASELESSLGVTLELERLFQNVTISQLSSHVLAELTAPSPPPAAIPAPAREAVAEYPLSYGQRALWFLQQVAPESAAYNLVHAARIPTELDIPALRRAFQKLVDRHPALRTTFAAPHGEPVQRVHEHMEVSFQVEDASTWSEEYLNARLAEEVYRPFDLERGPLMRVKLFTRSPQDHILVLGMHHIVTDLWSLAVFLHELGVLYTAEKTGVPASLKPLPAQYTDFVHWQAEMLAGPEGERLWEFWRKQLAGELPVLDLPTDRPRPPIQTDRGAAQTIHFSAELTQRLKSLARAHGVPLHTALLAAFQVLLHRYTGQEDILIGSLKAGRNWKLARVVGYFVNPVVIRGDLSGNPPFAAFLERMHQTARAAFEHGDYPYPLLVERLQPTRDPSRVSPLFQVVFAWQKTTRLLSGQNMASFALSDPGKRMELGELVLESMALEHRVSPFDLTLLMAEAGEELVASVEYNTDLYNKATIQRMLGHFQTLLESIVDDPNQPISTLSLLTEAERQQLLVEWNDTAAEYPQDRCVHELFEAQVERMPEAIAVTFEGKHLTYRELNRQANQLAHYLQKLGVGPETVVGICVERSPEMIVGLLGVLKAGGAYLPLDPTYPLERLTFMLEDANASVLLTQSHLLNRLGATRNTEHEEHKKHEKRITLCLDTDWPLIAQEPQTDPTSAVTPENLAYVIYTSGSTGQPKGTLLQHRGLCNLVNAQIRAFGVKANSRVLQFASFSFDASVSETFMALLTGATLCLARQETLSSVPDLQRLLQERAITTVTLPPSLLAVLPSEGLRSLQTVISAGESCSPLVAARWAPGRRFFNAYGPTEATIGPTLYRVEELPEDTSHVPIGHPIANTQVYILDQRQQPVPVGVPGELYIGGVGVARGYLNRPELTAERFIPDPFSGEPGARLYKTGDLARYLPDGNIEFLGRTDHQVKVRGFRVELGEIETVLGRHPALQKVVVVARDDVPGDRRLVAYVVPKEEPAPTTSELRRFLKEKLPEYMMPSVFVTLDTLPLTPSGKVDRRALPAPVGVRPELERAFVAPRTPVEEELASVWAQLLGIERVGIYDDFFELGGHSLLATQLLSRVRETFQVEVPLHSFFEAPTVTGLAALIAQSLAEQEDEAQMAQLLAELEQLSADEVREMLTSEMSS